MPGHGPTWEDLNRARFGWLADVAAEGGPVKAALTMEESMTTCLVAEDYGKSWSIALSMLRSEPWRFVAHRRLAVRAIEHIDYLSRAEPRPPPATFWLGAEGE